MCSGGPLMQINFENKKMLVNHPSGHVDEYNQQNLAEVLALTRKKRDDIQVEIDLFNNYIQQIAQS